MTKYSLGSEHNKATMGANGANVLVPADPATTAGVMYCAIHAMEESVVTAVENPENAAGDTAFSETILAGDTVVGLFSEIDVTSGRVRAYLSE